MTARRRAGVAVVFAVGLALGLVTANGRPAAAGTADNAGAATTYFVVLGDSLAAGTGASSPTKDYVSDLDRHEARRFPGLVAENLACGGATTGTVLSGGGACEYADGTQLAQAEGFLRHHRHETAFVAIDIGGNDVDGCASGSGIDASCVASGIALVAEQLPQILAGLDHADPGVAVLGMTYYDPFLASWFTSPSEAHESATLAASFNHALVRAYHAAGASVADVTPIFRTFDFALTGSYDGAAVPQNVANICAWTHECSQGDLHTNDAGHARLASAFEKTLLERCPTVHGAARCRRPRPRARPTVVGDAASDS